MSITVKFFASLREQQGRADASVEYQAGMTVLDVWRSLSGKGRLPKNVLTAVNLEYAPSSRKLNDGDEVAFFPPVTGG